MNSSPSELWKILSWNVRGLNSERRWDAIRDKIVESDCDIVCLQETKKENFDAQFIKKFCPREFDGWEFLPSLGASGGLLVILKTRLFTGDLIFNNEFAISVEFTSLHNSKNWILTNVYGPCSTEGKTLFTNCIKSIETWMKLIG